MAAHRPNRPGWIDDRLLIWLTVAAAVMAGLLFAARELSTEDLGYHLDYGNRLLSTGHPVDHDAALYTLPAPDTPAARRPTPGPGCWYDDAGRYRFPNANWLTQALIAISYQAGGVPALNAQLIVLVAGLLVLLVLLMRRLDVPPLIFGPAVLVLALVSYQRLTLRPELFGYVVLTAQACLLAALWRPGDHERPMSWRAVAGLIGLQILFVNLHSYFVLGLALTGATLVAAIARRGVTASMTPTHLLRLGVVMTGQVVACLVNPWTWRLAILPVQTVLFMRHNDVADGPAAHPWTSMGDLRRTTLFEHGWATDIVALAVLVCLGVIAAGAVSALRQRRWSLLLVMAGMTLVGFSAQRNLAVGMIIAVPCALAALAGASWWFDIRGRWARMLAGLSPRYTGPVAQRLAIVALSGPSFVLGWSIVTNGLYVMQDSPIRFGAGLSQMNLPIAAARWINEHDVEGRIWVSPLCSSTIRGFVRPRPTLNMITNTWAYPPEVMWQVLVASSSYGPVPFGPTAERFNVSVVVTQSGRFLRGLATDRRWVPVHVEGKFAVLVRDDGPDGDLADRHGMTQKGLDIARLIALTRRLDPAPGLATWMSARVLNDLGWHDAAIKMLADSVAENPSEPRAWIGTANARTARARRRDPADRAGVRDDMEQTVEALGRAWSLTHDPQLLANVTNIQQMLAGFTEEQEGRP